MLVDNAYLRDVTSYTRKARDFPSLLLLFVEILEIFFRPSGTSRKDNDWNYRIILEIILVNESKHE